MNVKEASSSWIRCEVIIIVKLKDAVGREETHLSRSIPAQQRDTLVWQNLYEVLMHPHQPTQVVKRTHGGERLSQELQAQRENLCKECAHLRQQRERLTMPTSRRLLRY